MTPPPGRARLWLVPLAVLALTAITGCDVFAGEDDADDDSVSEETDTDETDTDETSEGDSTGNEPAGDDDAADQAPGEVDEILIEDFERQHSLEFVEGKFLDVYGLVDDGQVLTLYWGWRNERDDDAEFSANRFGSYGSGDGLGLRLLDLANGKRYQVLEDENGDCLCSHPRGATLAPEGVKIMTNLYPLPEDDVDALTLETPQDGNIDGIAITEE